MVPVSFSLLGIKTHFQFGKILGKTCNLKPKTNIAIVASGDLSHRLTKDAPAGFSARGKEFDEKTLEKAFKDFEESRKIEKDEPPAGLYI